MLVKANQMAKQINLSFHFARFDLFTMEEVFEWKETMLRKELKSFGYMVIYGPVLFSPTERSSMSTCCQGKVVHLSWPITSKRRSVAHLTVKSTNLAKST